MPTNYFLHDSAHRHHSDGAPNHGASLRLPPQQYYAPHVPMEHH